MKRTLFLAIIILTVTINTFASTKSIGVFTAVSGTVEVQNSHDVTRLAKEGGMVNVLDVVYTHDNARAEILFHDGNIIRLAPKTRLKIKEYELKGSRSSHIINLLMGKLRNIVNVIYDSGQGTKEGGYEVHTPTAVCGVRGTDFFVYYEDNLSGAMFLKGKGYVYSMDVPDEIVTITAGQQMTVPSAKEPPRVGPARPEEIEKLKNATQLPRQAGKVKKPARVPTQKVTGKGLEQRPGQGKDKAGTDRPRGLLEAIRDFFNFAATKHTGEGQEKSEGKGSSKGKSVGAASGRDKGDSEKSQGKGSEFGRGSPASYGGGESAAYDADSGGDRGGGHGKDYGGNGGGGHGGGGGKDYGSNSGSGHGGGGHGKDHSDRAGGGHGGGGRKDYGGGHGGKHGDGRGGGHGGGRGKDHGNGRGGGKK